MYDPVMVLEENAVKTDADWALSRLASHLDGAAESQLPSLGRKVHSHRMSCSLHHLAAYIYGLHREQQNQPFV